MRPCARLLAKHALKKQPAPAWRNVQPVVAAGWSQKAVVRNTARSAASTLERLHGGQFARSDIGPEFKHFPVAFQNAQRRAESELNRALLLARTGLSMHLSKDLEQPSQRTIARLKYRARRFRLRMRASMFAAKQRSIERRKEKLKEYRSLVRQIYVRQRDRDRDRLLRVNTENEVMVLPKHPDFKRLRPPHLKVTGVLAAKRAASTPFIELAYKSDASNTSLLKEAARRFATIAIRGRFFAHAANIDRANPNAEEAAILYSTFWVAARLMKLLTRTKRREPVDSQFHLDFRAAKQAQLRLRNILYGLVLHLNAEDAIQRQELNDQFHSELHAAAEYRYDRKQARLATKLAREERRALRKRGIPVPAPPPPIDPPRHSATRRLVLAPQSGVSDEARDLPPHLALGRSTAASSRAKSHSVLPTLSASNPGAQRPLPLYPTLRPWGGMAGRKFRLRHGGAFPVQPWGGAVRLRGWWWLPIHPSTRPATGRQSLRTLAEFVPSGPLRPGALAVRRLQRATVDAKAVGVLITTRTPGRAALRTMSRFETPMALIHLPDPRVPPRSDEPRRLSDDENGDNLFFDTAFLVGSVHLNPAFRELIGDRMEVRWERMAGWRVPHTIDPVLKHAGSTLFEGVGAAVCGVPRLWWDGRPLPPKDSIHREQSLADRLEARQRQVRAKDCLSVALEVEVEHTEEDGSRKLGEDKEPDVALC